MKDQILLAMKDLTTFQAVLEKLDTKELVEEFKTTVTEVVTEKFKTLPESLQEEVNNLVEVESISLEGDVQNWSDIASTIYSEWNKEAAEFTVVAVLENGGTVRNEDKVITFGDLYGLEESHPLFEKPSFLTEKERLNLSNTNSGLFVKENSVCPVMGEIGWNIIYNKLNTLEQVSYGTDVELPLVLTEGGKHLLNFTSEGVEEMLEYYKLSVEDKKKILEVKAFVEEKELSAEKINEFYSNGMFNPLVISDNTLAELYLESEYSTNNFLAPLVGLVRQLGISKETFEQAQKRYSVLGSTTLKCLLERSWEDIEETPKVSQKPEVTQETPKGTDPFFDTFGRRKSTTKNKK